MDYSRFDSSRLLAADISTDEMGRGLEKEIRRTDLPSVHISAFPVGL